MYAPVSISLNNRSLPGKADQLPETFQDVSQTSSGEVRGQPEFWHVSSWSMWT